VVAAGRGDGRSAPYRRRVLLLLGVVLALDYADRATVGALGPDLKHAFGIGNAKFGLLASAFSVVGALATVPAGVLTDRMRRTLLLAVAVVLWSVAMTATGAAVGFAMLLGARVLLGAVTATARPATISMVGDAFPEELRGRALALVDSGELIGNGVGFLLAGVIAALLSWRSVFWALAAAGIAVAWFVWRLPEPERTIERPRRRRARRTLPEKIAAAAPDVEPDPELVLEGDQARMPLWQAARYVLRVRTNVIVIVSVACGYFFFAAVRTFGVIFITHAYGVGRSAADLLLLLVGAGALVGMLAGGPIGDALVRRGHLNGRIVVSSYSYLVAAIAFVPVVLTSSLALAIPCALLGSAALVAPSAPLDAVRLDVVHPQVWGRAEATRNVVQIAAEAGAPLIVGVLSERLAGGGAAGLRDTFLVTLGLLVVGALVLQLARRTYPREVAAAGESRARA
jgi:predicted MFS family arabinose efflux permease